MRLDPPPNIALNTQRMMPKNLFIFPSSLTISVSQLYREARADLEGTKGRGAHLSAHLLVADWGQPQFPLRRYIASERGRPGSTGVQRIESCTSSVACVHVSLGYANVGATWGGNRNGQLALHDGNLRKGKGSDAA